MRPWVAIALAAALLAAGCGGALTNGGGLLKKQYEYEEELYLALDGSATLNVNASVPALVALRGVDLNVSPRARFERERIRAFFEGPGVIVTAISSSRRYGRRFVHVSLDVADVRSLQRLPPFAWSSYRLDRAGDVYEFKQAVGASAQKPVGDVGWDGSELIAFRIHLPSKIPFHNAPSRTQRGNILEWEQTLTDRLHGAPIDTSSGDGIMQVQMETQSILAHTLLLFGSMIVAAFLAFAGVIWWVARSGQPAGGSGQEAA
jgi:hypothetical protein